MKNVLLSFLLSFSLTLVEANEDGHCIGHTHNHQHDFRELSSSVQEINDNIFSCGEEFYIEDANRAFKQVFNPSSPIKNKTIQGVKVRGRQDFLETTEKILKSYSDDGFTLPSWFKRKSANCKTPTCLLEAAFKNKEAALRAASITKRTGYVVSPGQKEHIQKKGDEYVWTPNDLRRLQSTLDMAPRELIGLKHLKQLYVLPEGYSRGANVLAWATPSIEGLFFSSKGSITFTHRSLHQSIPNSMETIFHEIAHHKDFDNLNMKADGTNFSELKDFIRLNNWTYKMGKKEVVEGVEIDVKKWKGDPSGCYVTSYSGQDPGENYAETLTWYLLYPKKLKEKCPKHYGYFKNKVFNGKEFTTPFPSEVDSIASCLETNQAYVISGNRQVVGNASLGANIVEVEKLPDLAINEECLEESIQQHLEDLQNTDKKSFCYHGGEQTLRGLMKTNLKRKADIQNGKLINALKKFNWELPKRICSDQSDISKECYQKVIIDLLSNETGIPKETIASGLVVKPKVNPAMVIEKVGSAAILSCMAEIPRKLSRNFEETWTREARYFCSDEFENQLKKAGIKLNEIDALMTGVNYFKDKTVLKSTLELYKIIKEARNHSSCKGFFGKKKCRREKIKQSLLEQSEQYRIFPETLTDELIKRLESKF